MYKIESGNEEGFLLKAENSSAFVYLDPFYRFRWH
ncbi:MAG TPA: hypothetical protein EYQ23_00010 [Verrucomicrobiales bacterium]|nr:hypothetical protein [Verrucomicrobiales bacterium]